VIKILQFRSSVVFFLFFLLSEIAFAGSWQIYNTQTGLPGNNVTSFAVTNGKMAIGTDKGAAVYSGDSCSWQVVALPESLARIYVRDIAYDETGSLWMATSGGVVRVSPDSVETMGIQDGLPTIDTERLQIFKQDIFVGTFGGYVLKSVIPDAGKGSFIPLNFFSSFSQDRVARMNSIGISGLAMQDSAKGWISTKGFGIIFSQGSSQMVLDMAKGLKSDWIESFWMFEGPQNSEHMLIGSLEGIDLVKDWKPVGFVNVPAKSDKTWITSLVTYYNEDNPELRKGENDSWSLETFLNRRTLWVGTNQDGLFRFERGKWTNYTSQNSALPSGAINRLYYHNGRLVVCTANGLAIIPLASNDYDEFKLIGLGNRNFKTIFPHLTQTPVNFLAKKNDFWVVSDAGLSRFIGVSGANLDFLGKSDNISSSMEGKETPEQDFSGSRPVTLGGELKWERFYKENGTLYSNNMNGLAVDDNGYVWLIFDEKIFARIRIEEIKNKDESEQNERKEKYIWDFFDGRNLPWSIGTKLTSLWHDDGKIYVGTEGDGFYLLNNPGAIASNIADIRFDWQHYAQIEGLLRENVIGFAHQIGVDKVTRVALLHPDGVTLWNGQSFNFVPIDGKRKYTCIADDAEGNIWLGSDGGGVIRLTPEMKTYQYTRGNAFFESDRITAIKSTATSQKNGISVWVATDNLKQGSDVLPTVKKRQIFEADIDGASVHYFDGLLWDKWKIPGVRCFHADGDYLWMGTNLRLRRISIPLMTEK